MNMRQLREQVNLRSVDVASKLNIGESTVRAWEKGKSTPSFNLVKPLIQLYGVSFNELDDAVKQTHKENHS